MHIFFLVGDSLKSNRNTSFEIQLSNESASFSASSSKVRESNKTSRCRATASALRAMSIEITVEADERLSFESFSSVTITSLKNNFVFLHVDDSEGLAAESQE